MNEKEKWKIKKEIYLKLWEGENIKEKHIVEMQKIDNLSPKKLLKLKEKLDNKQEASND